MFDPCAACWSSSCKVTFFCEISLASRSRLCCAGRSSPVTCARSDLSCVIADVEHVALTIDFALLDVADRQQQCFGERVGDLAGLAGTRGLSRDLDRAEIGVGLGHDLGCEITRVAADLFGDTVGYVAGLHEKRGLLGGDGRQQTVARGRLCCWLPSRTGCAPQSTRCLGPLSSLRAWVPATLQQPRRVQRGSR